MTLCEPLLKKEVYSFVLILILLFICLNIADMRSDLEKSIEVNDSLRAKSSKDTLKVMKENAVLLEKNQSLLSTMAETKQISANSGSKQKERLVELEAENKALCDQMKKTTDSVIKFETMATEQANSFAAEKLKLKSEIKTLQHQGLAAEVLRKDELARATKERESSIAELEELRALLQLSESKITQNAATFDAEKERIFTLENSKAQIRAAEARIAFSTEKRKLKEEISGLNIRINQIESEASEAKSSYSCLEVKLKEVELSSKADADSVEERVTALLKAVDLYDPSAHSDGLVSRRGQWADSLRAQHDKCNSKVVILIKYLQRFKDQIDSGDSHLLLAAGVSLA